MTHDGQRMDLDAAYGYEIVENEEGLSGVVDTEGNIVLPCIYNKVELKAYGFATLYSRKKIDRERPWIDLLNGVRFIKRPKIEKIGFLEFSTTDGLRFYPRVRTRQMDESCFVLAESLEHGIDYGLRFKTFYVQPSEPNKLYSFKEKMDDVQLWEDENGNLAWKEEFETSLHPTNQDEWETRKKKHSDETKKYARDVHQYIWHFKPKIQIDSLFKNRLLKDNKDVAAVHVREIPYPRHFPKQRYNLHVVTFCPWLNILPLRDCCLHPFSESHRMRVRSIHPFCHRTE